MNLQKAHESLHSDASSLLRFNLEWGELEAQFDSVRSGLRRRFRELQTLEDQIDRREKSLESAKFNFDAEMAGRVQELRRVDRLVESGNNRLSSLRSLIQEHDEELIDKERRFSELGKMIKEVEKEWEKNLKSIEKLFVGESKDHKKTGTTSTHEERSKDSSFIENLIREDRKCKEADEVVLGKLNNAVREKESELNSVAKSLEEKEKQLREMNVKLRCIGGQNNDIHENDSRIEAAERVIEELSKRIECLKEEERSMEMSERHKIWEA